MTTRSHSDFQILPLADRVLISNPEIPSESKKEKIVGGIVIPDSAQASTVAGVSNPHSVVKVLAIGEKCTVVKPGQRIVVRRPNCFPVKVGGVEHIFIREADIVARVQ